MEKNAIKKFAVWARRELISRVSQSAAQYGITEDDLGDENADIVNGHLLTEAEKKQRQSLIHAIKRNGWQQTIEEAAYVWFNRFSALRYMEVNDYLPSHIRVFTDEQNAFKPQILSEAIHVEIDGLDKNRVYDLANSNKTDELYKYLIITQCNALSSILPGLFQKIEDYTQLLFPEHILREGSVIEQMVTLIPEEDWKDQVQIIGWLYQYYNTEPKDMVFANLKKNIKISKEDIPAATQLFTPDWIVHYMVENSLGRLWLEGHPNDAMKAGWKYYLDEAQQDADVEAQLKTLREQYAGLKPEDIRVIDPCMGSGHILAVMFDVLMQIYESYGHTAREAASKIVENNLWGLDIDERAAQLAYFAVMMKARKYDRRFFTRKVQPHVYAIAESNGISKATIKYFLTKDATLRNATGKLIKNLRNAKEYGSLIQFKGVDFEALDTRIEEIRNEDGLSKESVLKSMVPLMQTGKALAQKYEVVCTNPPYMGSSGMEADLSSFVKKNYHDSRSDLFAAFIERCGQLTEDNGCQAMITQHSWMFLSSYEKLRSKLLNTDIVNMVHLGARAFEEIGGEVVQTTSFVLRKSHIIDHKGIYCRLIEPTTQQGKEDMFLAGENRYATDQTNFSKIPGAPVAYWVSDNAANAFLSEHIVDHYIVRNGISTGDNERNLRLWHEVDYTTDYWKPCNKGGSFRKWYGNNEYYVNWENDGEEIRTRLDSKGRIKARLGGIEHSFSKGIEMSRITSGTLAFRISNGGFVYESSTNDIYQQNETWKLITLLAYCNTKVVSFFLNLLNPTINIMPDDIRKLPCPNHSIENSENIALNCIALSRTDWDSYETSWDFKHHPMLTPGKISDAYNAWKTDCEDRFLKLKANEEELNRIFIGIYGLQDELTPDVADKDVTVHRIFDTKDDVPESMKGSSYVRTMRDEVVSLISYAVGCLFGRYSLDEDGLAYAGGEWDPSKYETCPADSDNVIPICDDEYFDDDLTGLFVNWVEAAYGSDTLEENLKFIASALGGKGSARQVIRSYFLNNFYADHVKTYQKRPIYWLFDSGKKNGFKALIYMHRYQPSTLATIRTAYVHEQHGRYRAQLENLEKRIKNAPASVQLKLGKQAAKFQAQSDEITAFEEKIHRLADQMIAIDLDDGVKVNYAKFADVLAKIK